MQKTAPILSIITISFNDREGLVKTVESVKEQTFKAFEYIVIDGGSADGSHEYLKENSELFSYFCSEKDKGIYDAQNKGILKSSGKYLLFLNAGDTFFSPDVVEKFIKFAGANEKAIIYGNTNLINERGQELLRQPDKLDLDFWYMGTLNHQATFIQRTLFTQFGLYDLKYKICADFELFVKAYVAGADMFIHFDEVVCNYDQFGFSSSKENFEKMMDEHQEILMKNLSDEEYKRIKQNYRSKLPLKGQVLAFIGERPVLNSAFKYVFGAYKRIKSDGKK